KIKLIGVLLSGILIPAIIFIILLGKYLDAVYLNVITANMLIRADQWDLYLKNIPEMLSFFLIPQNIFLIFLILYSGFKFDLFEKFIILNIILFSIAHFNTLMFAEYLVPVIPLFLILIYKRYDILQQKFSNLKLNHNKN